MSAAAGAPPSPPPPPQHGASFDDLPAELLLIVSEYAGLENFMDLALAIYPTLQRHGLVPELTAETLHRIEYGWHRVQGRPNLRTGFHTLPPELAQGIIDYLEPTDAMALVFAAWHRFCRIPSRDTMTRLRVWSRRSRKK